MGMYNGEVDDSIALLKQARRFTLIILHDYTKENTIIVIVPPTIQFLYRIAWCRKKCNQTLIL